MNTAGEIMKQLTISSEEIRNYKSKNKSDFKIRDMTNFADDVVDYFYKELKSGKSLGLTKMDSGYLCRLSEVNLITGISGHGKTQMLMQWVHNLSKTGKCLIMSMEMRP